MLELGSCSNQTSSLEESRETLVSLSSEGLEEETMGPSRATLWTHVIMDSSRGGVKVAPGQKGRQGLYSCAKLHMLTDFECGHGRLKADDNNLYCRNPVFLRLLLTYHFIGSSKGPGEVELSLHEEMTQERLGTSPRSHSW